MELKNKIWPSKIPINRYLRSQSTDSRYLQQQPHKSHLEKMVKFNQISPLEEKEILHDFEMKKQINEIIPNYFEQKKFMRISDIDTSEYENKLLDRLKKIELSLLSMREDQALCDYNKKLSGSIGKYDKVFKVMKKDDLGNQMARYNLGYKHLRKGSIERLIQNRSCSFKVMYFLFVKRKELILIVFNFYRFILIKWTLNILYIC